MRLTTTQVSLIAAAIALGALGRIAAYVSEPEARPNPFEATAVDQWRRFAAQVEAFASTQVIALRDALLAAWERYRAAVDAVGAAGSPEDVAGHGKEAEGYSAEVRVVYADLISRVREELEQGRDPWWRRWLRAAAADAVLRPKSN